MTLSVEPISPPNERAKVSTVVDGMPVEMQIESVRGDWVDYYRNIADVLLRGGELIVKPEETREVVRVIEAAHKSAKLGKPIKL